MTKNILFLLKKGVNLTFKMRDYTFCPLILDMPQ